MSKINFRMKGHVKYNKESGGNFDAVVNAINRLLEKRTWLRIQS